MLSQQHHRCSIVNHMSSWSLRLTIEHSTAKPQKGKSARGIRGAKAPKHHLQLSNDNEFRHKRKQWTNDNNKTPKLSISARPRSLNKHFLFSNSLFLGVSFFSSLCFFEYFFIAFLRLVFGVLLFGCQNLGNCVGTSNNHWKLQHSWEEKNCVWVSTYVSHLIVIETNWKVAANVLLIAEMTETKNLFIIIEQHTMIQFNANAYVATSYIRRCFIKKKKNNILKFHRNNHT